MALPFRSHRGLALAVGAALLLAAGGWRYSALRRDRRLGVPAWPRGSPPVVLVILDTLRADRLGAYGYKRPTSPRLDALAADAVLFENAYSQAPNTPPSIASILTSLYPAAHHFIGKDDRLGEGALTLAEIFHAAGYRTGGFVDSGFLRRHFGFGQGFETYDDEGGGFEKILPKAAAWVRAEPGRPYFLLLHTYDIHTPYEDTPSPYRDAFLEEAYAGELTSEGLEKVRTGEAGRKLTPAETRHFSDLYDGGILHADARLGGFLDALRADGLLDRMVVAVTSDHGEEFMEHGSVLHEKLYRTVTHVPFLLRLPGRAHAGLRARDVVESLDIAPTLLAAAGVPIHAGMQGRSLLPLLRGEPLADAQAVSQVTWDPEELGYYRGDSHLLLNSRSGKLELYDVGRDPLEQENLAAPGARTIPDLQAALAARLRESMPRGYLAPVDPSDAGLDPETKKSLRALGYVR